MDRRAYLVGASSVAVAGCLGRIPGVGGGSDESEQEAEQQSQDEPPASSMNESDSMEDAEPTEDVEPESEPEPDQADDDRQETNDRIEFDRAISRAERQYRQALAEYGKATGRSDASFLHVLPSTDVDPHNANSHIDEAANILWEDASEYVQTEADQQRLTEYRRYEELIFTLSRIQRDIHQAYATIESPNTPAVYAEPPSELSRATERHDAAAETIAEMELYMGELGTKYEQQRWQIDLLERTFAGLVRIKNPNTIDDRSATQLQLARTEFNAVRRQLEDTGSAPPEDSTDEAYLELITGWIELVNSALR